MSGLDTEGGYRTIYRQRVNAVMDYIEANLQGDLTLAQLAGVAQFSPYHFHRIFLAVTGETLNTFINRVRLERSAAILLQQRGRQVTEIAYECGFSSPSSFARSFKEHYKVTPTGWRSVGGVRDADRQSGRSMLGDSFEVSAVAEGWSIVGPGLDVTSVSLTRIASSELAYVRYVGPFQGSTEVFSDLFSRLYSWARPQGLIHENADVYAVYHDNPSLTADDKLRVSACVAVPEDIKPSGEIGRMRFFGGLYAVGSFALAADDYQNAWNTMWSGWLPDSGYEPTDGFVFERFVNPTESANRIGVEIAIPVQTLT